jgi:hypothetical protein
MAIQFSTDVRNARLDAIETAIGSSPILRVRTGSAPANCNAADSGTVLAEIVCPSNWMSDAASGSKGLLGSWQDISADDTGTAGHFRIYDSAGTVCHIQGTITATGGGGDLEVGSTSFSSGLSFTITSFTLTDGNA